MTDRRNLDVVEAELNQLDSLCQQFHDAHNLYYDELATPEEREIASRYFNDKESNIFKCWILQCEARISDNLERLSDKRSAKSRSSRSSKVDFISSHLSSISHLAVLNHPQNMQAVVQKLPYALQTKWRENVVKTRRKDGKVAGVAELVEFSEYAAESANDPVYGKEALNKARQRTNGPPQSNKGSLSFKPKVDSFVNGLDTVSKPPSSHGTGSSNQNVNVRR